MPRRRSGFAGGGVPDPPGHRAGAQRHRALPRRSAFIKQLELVYVLALRSRGILEREILFRHVLRAAAAGLTVLSLPLIGLLGRVVIIESIFVLSGPGRLAVDATIQGDLPLVMGEVLYSA